MTRKPGRVFEWVSRRLVIKAINEYDSLGAGLFLSTYRFGASKEYWLVYKGRHYPSKAIFGVARKFHPDFLRPLRSEEFGGGRGGVVPTLEDRGFEILKEKTPASVRIKARGSSVKREHKSAYGELAKYLQSLAQDRILLSFAKIELIIGRKLPPSAKKHPAWWANSSRKKFHPWAYQWVFAGWKAEGLDLARKRVAFRRASSEAVEESSSRPKDRLDVLSEKFSLRVYRSMTDSKWARDARLKKARKHPMSSQIKVRIFARNPDVVAAVLVRAKGKCEECHSKAPFLRRKDGTPFLEIHHRVRLADKGEDTVKNAMALCPNCHRELHYGMAKLR